MSEETIRDSLSVDNVRAHVEPIVTEIPTIPCIGIACTAGLRLKQMCESGKPVQARFRTHVENGRRPIQITVGEVPSPHGDDFVVIGGRQDSWFGEAATGNSGKAQIEAESV